ncbi:hypothetical protein EZV62_026968 [Acer yangbiense]|uniref:Bulb-type lectin domain-containing protein n=1 Tax=Acer yangbiense TaxID=1000413 RepID=A0A5C7GSB2_9ROSI|nr:hypothetical protein EZV62_026968 [Acer yangbiense]
MIMAIRSWKSFLELFILLYFAYLLAAAAQNYDPPSALPFTSWTTYDLPASQITYGSEVIMRIILFKRVPNSSFDIGFAFGFVSYRPISSTFLGAASVSLTITNGYDVEVFWLANRNKPVHENATLQLQKNGDLILTDGDGTLVWSTNTSNMSVAGLQMSNTGNLVLYGDNNQTLWQSFDHPTDTLVPGQKLMARQKLVSRASATNWTEGSFYLSVSSEGLFAFYRSNVPQMYFKFSVSGIKESEQPSYIRAVKGTLALYILSAEPSVPDAVLSSPVDYTEYAYMRLDSDGHLRFYDGGIDPVDILADDLEECDYPTVCGNYGLCSNGQCSCPYGFYQNNVSDNPNKFGCTEINPVTCENGSQSLFPLKDVYYFNYVDPDAADLKGIHMESCKDACLRNCSCKVAMFRFYYNISHGNCFLLSNVLSLMKEGQGRSPYHSYAFIKLPKEQESQRLSSESAAPPTGAIAGVTVGTFILVVLVVGFCILSEDDCLIDLVDKDSEDMQLHREEVVQMMRVAVWCLQNDYNRRPSMSTVVKVLEGTMEFEASLTAITREADEQFGNTTSALLPSILSGPRLLGASNAMQNFIISALFGLQMIKTGNLVLHNDNNRTIWQSFDQPMDTLLPGQKLVSRASAYDWNEAAAQYHDYPSAKLSASWTNNNLSAINITQDYSEVTMRVIRLNVPDPSSEIGFACGFVYNLSTDSSFLATASVSLYSPNNVGEQSYWYIVEVLWLANRNKPVHENATLELHTNGDLILRDADGSFVWSTNTSHMSVAGLQMLNTGNLVLFDDNNKTIWQSFDQPMDTLLPGQKQMAGQKLEIKGIYPQVPSEVTMQIILLKVPNSKFEIGFAFGFVYNQSTGSNFLGVASARRQQPFYTGGQSYLSNVEVYWLANRNKPVHENATLDLHTNGDLILRDADGTLVWSTNTSHMSVAGSGIKESEQPSYIRVVNGTLALYILSAEPSEPDAVLSSPLNNSENVYMRLDSDGYLRFYPDITEYYYGGFYHDQVDILADLLRECDYPTVCGNYGLCSNGQCSCLNGFDRDNQSKFGCTEINPVTCENGQSQSLLPFKDIYYFNYIDPDAADLKGIHMESCKDACLRNCSCRVAMFQYYYDISHGNCFLLSNVLSLMNEGQGRSPYHSYAFIKEQESQRLSSISAAPPTRAIAGVTVGTFVLVVLVVGFCILSEDDCLIDLVDKDSEDMQLHGEEVVQMMRVAVWCLQNDYNRRPSMSTVVKVLEGTMEFEASLTAITREAEEQFGNTTSALLPSILSGPR